MELIKQVGGGGGKVTCKALTSIFSVFIELQIQYGFLFNFDLFKSFVFKIFDVYLFIYLLFLLCTISPSKKIQTHISF